MAHLVGQGGYRYGFNVKEKYDDLTKTTGATYDYGVRIYDARIAKFLSVDPLTMDYLGWSPYPFAMNRSIDGIDLDGLEMLDYWANYVMKVGKLQMGDGSYITVYNLIRESTGHIHSTYNLENQFTESSSAKADDEMQAIDAFKKIYCVVTASRSKIRSAFNLINWDGEFAEKMKSDNAFKEQIFNGIMADVMNYIVGSRDDRRDFSNYPLGFPSVSLYATIGNSPIWFTDVLGDTAVVKWRSGGFLGLRKHEARYVNDKWIDAKTRQSVDISTVSSSAKNLMDHYSTMNTLSSFDPMTDKFNAAKNIVNLSGNNGPNQLGPEVDTKKYFIELYNGNRSCMGYITKW